MTTAANYQRPNNLRIPAPEGFIILGEGGNFETGGINFDCMMLRQGDNSSWRAAEDRDGSSPTNWYALPANHPVVQLNMPELPENATILGYARDALSILEGRGIEQYWVVSENDDLWTPWRSDNTRPMDHWVVAAITEASTVSIEQEAAIRAVRQWDLVLGSDVVDANNLREEIANSQLLTNPENLESIVDDLDEAMRRSDPEVSIEHWIDREPSLLAILEFAPIASTGGVDIHEIAEGSAPIADMIIKATAGVMLRGGLSDHFRYLEDGTLTIDPSNPPTVEHAYELLKRTLETKETASKLENYSAWMLGMIADQFEGYFQDRFDPSVIMAQTSRAYNTYICSLKTFRSWWSERRPNLSFTHHREVEYAKHLDREKACQVLDISSRFNLTVLQQRKVISYARRFDLVALQQEMAEQGQDGVEDLMERIDIRSVNKRYVFFLRSANRWYEYKGPFEHIPNGASPIINADTREVMQQDGTAMKPNEWIPVGEAIPAEIQDDAPHEEVEEQEDQEAV